MRSSSEVELADQFRDLLPLLEGVKFLDCSLALLRRLAAETLETAPQAGKEVVIEILRSARGVHSLGREKKEAFGRMSGELLLIVENHVGDAANATMTAFAIFCDVLDDDSLLEDYMARRALGDSIAEALIYLDDVEDAGGANQGAEVSCADIDAIAQIPAQPALSESIFSEMIAMIRSM